jgi:hypothetical protein
MRISFKTILGLWIGLFCLIGILFFSAYSKLNPDLFVENIGRELKRSIPGATLVVGAKQYKLAVDFNFVLKDILVQRAGQDLAKLGELEVRVPWWLVLFNRGSAQINLSEVTIFIEPAAREVKQAATDTVSNTDLSIHLPGFLSEAQYTLRAKNVSLRNRHNQRNYFTLSKLLVREFQYGKNSAFELNVPVKITQPGASFQSELWLFGDVTPQADAWALNFRGEFRTVETRDKTQMEDLILDGKATFDPSSSTLSSNMDLLIDRQPVGKSTLTANPSHFSLVADLQDIPVSFLSMAGDTGINPFWTNLNGAANGSVAFTKNLNKRSSLKGKLNFDGSIALSPTVEMAGKWQLSFEDARWDTSFISPQGEVSYFRRAHYDFEKAEVTQFAQELGFTGMQLEAVSGTMVSLGELMKLEPQVFFTANVAYKNCSWGSQPLEGHLRYGVTPDQRFYVSELKSDKSKFKLNYLMKGTEEQLDLDANDFHLQPGANFLEPFFSAQSARIDGKIQGRWSAGEWLKGKWLVKLKGHELQQMKGNLPDINDRIIDLFGIKPGQATTQDWDIHVHDNAMKINSLVVNGAEAAHISGQLSEDHAQKSWLILGHPNDKNVKPVRKEIDDTFWKEVL